VGTSGRGRPRPLTGIERPALNCPRAVGGCACFTPSRQRPSRPSIRESLTTLETTMKNQHFSRVARAQQAKRAQLQVKRLAQPSANVAQQPFVPRWAVLVLCLVLA